MSRETDAPRVVVLGAGLTGLAAARRLCAEGAEVTVLEKEPGPGGLASTCAENGFRFDHGPHRFHTQEDWILERVRDLLPDELMQLERKSRIRLLDRYFRYPLSFGDVLRRMPLSQGAAMVFSYMAEKLGNIVAPRKEESFEDWVVKRFGHKLYDLYFRPYTAKLWGFAPHQLSVDWASQRITVPSLSGLLRETLLPSSGKIRSLVSTFHYPRRGIGRIAEVLAERVGDMGGAIHYRTVPRRITGGQGSFVIHTAGEQLRADRVVSTIPLPEYVRLLGDVLPEGLERSAEQLLYRAVVFVALRVDAEIPVEDHWIYASEDRYLFNRISFPENFDPGMSPEGGFQAVFEFSCQENDDLWNGDRRLVEAAVTGGERLGLLRADEVIDHTISRQAHAYPIYRKGYSDPLSEVLRAMEELEGSVTCGRQGLFRYNNMDHSIEMGEYAAMETLGRGSVGERFDWSKDTWADG
ncbi:FAD-dependent oxidoreductase [Candidatus Fermentibacteria bacterium]|nr:FAD-dependent oxidoreductase [Candidatus Fermentibacteria bacterium]